MSALLALVFRTVLSLLVLRTLSPAEQILTSLASGLEVNPCGPGHDPLALTQRKFSVSLGLSQGITRAVFPLKALQKPFLFHQLMEATGVPLQ